MLFAAEEMGYIYSSPDSGTTWTAQTGPGASGVWAAVASSSDLSKLIAAKGNIYTSNDFGATWTQRTNNSDSWKSVASSSDGTKLFAASSSVDGSGYLYTSTDSGATWTQQTNAGSRNWWSAASSSDGAKLLAADSGDYYNGGYLYASNDSGATWTQRTAAGQRCWWTVASSSDGMKLVAAEVGSAGSGGYIYTSTDSGASWKQRANAGRRPWCALASSSDGKRLAAADGGYIYISKDSGSTWTRRTGAGKKTCAVSLSSDGKTLVAAEYGGQIYVSKDSGATWTQQTSTGLQNWLSLSTSSDGSRIVAASGAIWTASPPAIPVVDNPASISVTTSTATLEATIEYNGGAPVTAAGVAFGKDENPDNSGNKKGSGATNGNFTLTLTGLASNTLYHFRGYAANWAGTGYTGDAQFTTVARAPSAKAASDLVPGGFTADWTAPVGPAAIRSYQLDVAMDPHFSSFVAGYENLSVTGTSAPVVGLASGATYYYRVRAVNDGGTSANSNSIAVSHLPSGPTAAAPASLSRLPSGKPLAVEDKIIITPPVALPVRASAGPDQAVHKLALVELSGSNSINFGGPDAFYLWTQLDGPPVTVEDPAAVETRFIAPEGGPEGKSLRFQLTVTDAQGAESTDECIVNVVEDEAPPIANAGSNQTVAAARIVGLDGSRSSASGAGVLSYSWRQMSGMKVELSDPSAARPTFVAPNIDSVGAPFNFELTVTDRAGLRSRDTCIVNVSANALPPKANAGANQSAQSGDLVVLDGTGSVNENGGIASYSWRQTAGAPVTLSDPTAIGPAFTAPAIDMPTQDLVFELTVTNSDGLQDKAGTVVKVMGADVSH